MARVNQRQWHLEYYVNDLTWSELLLQDQLDYLLEQMTEANYCFSYRGVYCYVLFWCVYIYIYIYRERERERKIAGIEPIVGLTRFSCNDLFRINSTTCSSR